MSSSAPLLVLYMMDYLDCVVHNNAEEQFNPQCRSADHPQGDLTYGRDGWIQSRLLQECILFPVTI